jgi:predicted nucleic acid-binding protein
VGFLIDTSLWIAIERGDLEPADIHALTHQAPIFLSPVNLAEFRYGIELLAEGPAKQNALRMLRKLRRKPLLRITGETGEVFGTLAAKLRQTRRGSDFRIQDLWLAAQAIQRGFKVLTANARDFKDIPGLDCIEVKI